MAKLDRAQIREAITRSMPGDYRIVAADSDEEAEAGDQADAYSVPAATLDAMRVRYKESLNGSSAPPSTRIETTSQFVVLEPDDDLVTDFKAPNRRVRIFSESGDLIAEQG